MKHLTKSPTTAVMKPTLKANLNQARLILPLLGAISLQTGCSGPVSDLIPKSSASPAASPLMTVSASPLASTQPPVSPEPVLSAPTIPEPVVSSQATPTPTPARTPSADSSPSAILTQPAAGNGTATPGLDTSTLENTTLNGKVFDLTGAPIEGVKIVVHSLSSASDYSVEATTVGGTYSFNNAPAGVQLEILATKEGYTPRRRVEVLKSNKTGDPKLNRYDFGTDGTSDSTGSAINAMTDSPEVIQVTPGRNASGVAPTTTFSLTFSEPMNRESVEKTFSIRAFNSAKLTVDLASTGPTFAGDSNPNTITNPLIWDKNAFNISWNSSSTQVTFAFKEDKALPSDKDSSKVPTYEMVFNTPNGRTLNDAGGASRNSLHFRVADSALEESIRFSLAPDTTIPYLATLTSQTAENGGNNGDALQVVYSKPMLIPTLSRSVAGGLEDRGNVAGSEVKAPAVQPEATSNATARNTAKNYTLQINQAGGESLAMRWFDVGGTAIFDTRDDSRRTVLLLPPQQGPLNATVAGAPVQGDAITGTALLKNGNTVTLNTQTIKTQSNLTADHVAGTVNLSNPGTETISIFYTDGSSDINLDLSNPAANTFTALRNSLGNLTTGGIADWTVTTQQSGGGAGNDNVELNDRVNLALAANATRNGKSIAWVSFNGGVFAPTQLNMAGYVAVTTPLKVVQAALNAGFDLTGGRFTLTETDAAGGPGVLAAGDQLTLTLGAAPRIGNKTVFSVSLSPSGLFGNTRLNSPSGGYLIFPNTQVNGMVDVFQPGDAIQVTVANTVLDPAGNTIDSSRNRVSATAS